MTFPIYLTFFRILLSPLFPVFYLGYESLGISVVWVPYILLFILILSESTDLFDGWLARRHNQVTNFGKIIDPMADTIARITVVFTFTQGVVNLPMLIAFTFLYREFFIGALRTLCALQGVALAARKSGKIKAILQAVMAIVVVLFLIPYVYGWLSLITLQRISLFLFSIGAIYTVLSGIDYIFINKDYIKKALL